jgi:alcohol dehydrogenase class IV
VKPFSYFQPTELRFGRGGFDQAGELVARYGRRCLLVTRPVHGVFTEIVRHVKDLLAENGVAVAHFAGVVPNPTTDCVGDGAELARSFGADVVLGVGGGSSMDTAKAIAVEATHPGRAWDYLWCSDSQPTASTLPVIAVTTTSGTGSHLTQVAVVTNTAERTKSALFDAHLFPRVAIVDPDLMVTVPPHVTASTGFDVFCHAFESYLHPNASSLTDMLALEAIRLVVKHLPLAVREAANQDARCGMAWADTLAGLCIANAGVTLPHGIGMTISGQCPQVMHGEALAVVYPEFTRFTYPYALDRFATLGEILNPALAGLPTETAAERACDELDELLKKTGMWLNLKSLGVTPSDVVAIADNSRVLPDYKNNPRIAERDEIYEMLARSYDR